MRGKLRVRRRRCLATRLSRWRARVGARRRGIAGLTHLFVAAVPLAAALSKWRDFAAGEGRTRRLQSRAVLFLSSMSLRKAWGMFVLVARALRDENAEALRLRQRVEGLTRKTSMAALAEARAWCLSTWAANARLQRWLRIMCGRQDRLAGRETLLQWRRGAHRRRQMRCVARRIMLGTASSAWLQWTNAAHASRRRRVHAHALAAHSARRARARAVRGAFRRWCLAGAHRSLLSVWGLGFRV